MPTWTTTPERGVPVRLSLFHGLPKDEIPHVGLFVLVRIHAEIGNHPFAIQARQPSVLRERIQSEINGTLAPVSVARLEQPQDQRHHLGNVARRPRVMLGALHAESVQVFEKGTDIGFGILIQAQPSGIGAPDRLVVNVGNVHHLDHPESPGLQVAPE